MCYSDGFLLDKICFDLSTNFLKLFKLSIFLNITTLIYLSSFDRVSVSDVWVIFLMPFKYRPPFQYLDVTSNWPLLRGVHVIMPEPGQCNL